MDSPACDDWNADRFLGHPRLHAAACVAITYSLNRLHGSWLRNRLLNDRGRFLLALLLLDLHLSQEAGLGITAAQIRREATRYGICSNGRAIAFIAALRFANFLAAAPQVQGREKRLIPTPTLMDLHHIRWRSLIQAVAMMDESVGRCADAMPNDAFLHRCTCGLARLFRAGVRLMDSVPVLSAFAERDAGVAILLTLFLAQARGETVTVAAAARSFSVSRAHAADVLQAAERQNLATFHGPRLGFGGTDQLKAAVERFYCDIFAMVCYALEV